MTRFGKAAKAAMKPSFKTILWLLKIMIPVSLGVKVLEYVGFLQWLAELIKPVVAVWGLPGESALVILSGALLNIYSAIAIIDSLDFTIREITIMSIMVLIAHNLIIETAVQKKTGSSPVSMLLVRLISAIVAGFIFNLLLPAEASHLGNGTTASGYTTPPFFDFFSVWAVSTFWLIIKIVIIIISLQVLHNVLEEFKILDMLSKGMLPLMKLFGLPLQSSFMWLVANVVGLAWGSAILIEYVKSGKINKYEANLLNHHVAVSHSLLEDTLLFVAIGINALWITFPRLIMAIVIVWGVKILFKNKAKQSAVSS
ncbi:MAG TPA: nucleoside recognition domain-containing protein [Bacteroidales bacterium]|nr:nucleoside recognition domain-containing protein [Bacteroidales bacterium]